MENKEKIKQKWCDALLNARERLVPADPLSSAFGDLPIDAAYEVQEMGTKERVDKGERIIGWKIGATSRAVMDQLYWLRPYALYEILEPWPAQLGFSDQLWDELIQKIDKRNAGRQAQ